MHTDIKMSEKETAVPTCLPDTMSEPRSEQKGPKVYRLVGSVKSALFILSTGLLFFAAARNSFHWHIHRVWGATGSLWQSIWDYTYNDVFFKNDFLFAITGTMVVTSIVFWLSNLPFILLDVFGFPAWLLKYKVQDEKQVELPQFLKTLRRVLFNQFIIGIPFSIGVYYMMALRGCEMGGELPTFTWVMLEIIVHTLVEEVFFYYTHRLFHHPKLYRHIHKIHHEWTAPTSIVSIYAHPLEHVVSNLLPVALGPVFMGSHLATAWLWFSLALMSTTVAHSGYHLPLFPSPEAHDYHHLKFNNCFGVLGVLDRLHGTDLQFRASKQYQRHVMLLNSVPLNQQIPDSPKKKPE